MEKYINIQAFKGSIPEINLMEERILSMRDELLIKIASDYLGRPFDINTDLERIKLASIIGKTDTFVSIDGNIVGHIEFGLGYNGDDFSCNQFSVYYQFYPNSPIPKPA